MQNLANDARRVEKKTQDEFSKSDVPLSPSKRHLLKFVGL